MPGPVPGISLWAARWPGSQRTSIGVAVAVSACATLASCGDVSRLIDLTVPARIAGLSDGARALPIRAWIAEKEVVAEAMAGCLEADCRAIAIGLFRARGDAARAIRAVLDDPSRLGRELDRQRASSRKPSAAGSVRAEIDRLSENGVQGFTIRLARADGDRPVVGAVLGTSGRDPLRFLVAIGSDETVVDTARRIARAELR